MRDKGLSFKLDLGKDGIRGSLRASAGPALQRRPKAGGIGRETPCWTDLIWDLIWVCMVVGAGTGRGGEPSAAPQRSPVPRQFRGPGKPWRRPARVVLHFDSCERGVFGSGCPIATRRRLQGNPNRPPSSRGAGRQRAERSANPPQPAGPEEGREGTGGRPRTQTRRGVAIEVARATRPRRAGAGAMPIRLETALTGGEYVTRRACCFAHSFVASGSHWAGGKLLPERKDPGQASLRIDARRAS